MTESNFAHELSQCLAGTVDLIELLLVHGADPDVLDENGSALPHYSCQFDDIELAEILLNNCANRYLRDERGSRAIDYATRDEPSPENQKLIELLKNIPHHPKK